MEEKSKIAELRGSIEECKGRIKEFSECVCRYTALLSDLYIDLFYAENGMERGQHFMYNGKEYAKIVEGDDVCIKACPLTKSGKISLMGRNIYKHEYSKILPLSMNK